MRKKLLLFAMVLSACGAPVSTPDADVSLMPYLTATSAPTTTPDVLVIIETPVPTSTPQVYAVQQGDTLSGIAEKFNVSLDALRAANPDLKTSILSIGQTLFIPDPSAPLAAASTPTPVPAPVTQTVCHPTADSGLWCFALIQNDSDGYLENVSAQITLLDENGGVIASQTAFPPLDIIAPHSSLPVYVHFPNISKTIKPQVQILSAMQTSGIRYLPVSLHNTITEIDWDGKFAQVSGQITLPAESDAATQVWVAAVAYDKNGTVVGVKRWEGGALEPGAMIRFDFSVASVGGIIEAVEFFVQAR
ncbi:MAG: LysM peptidoglycan-binding domain-containing protein [Anaerolineales bacterium]|nr:LysM peptidoglycan-binding domain-containing protein [Anaerolineales bacterium]